VNVLADLRRDTPALLIAIVIGAPVAAAILVGIFAGGGEAWGHIAGTKLWTYTGNTLLLLGLTAALILIMAVPAAWLVTMHDFPGRGVFEWLLILSLAAPGYVIAYAYADLMGVAGPLQSGLRDMTGLGARDYWFPEINSLYGCAFVLACALYPYVYLTARAAFTSQSICALEAARSLGASPARAFRDVALPGARPAIAAGLALALMEAAADYGAADFLGVQTLTVGIVRARDSFGDAGVAARMALFLLGIALLLQWLERAQRGGAGSQQSSTRWRHLSRAPLPGWKHWGASLFCAAIFTLGFLAPIGRLIWRAVETQDVSAPVLAAARNSIFLASGGALLAFLFAVAIAVGARQKSQSAKLARLAATSGYAVPGAVLALGGLMLAGLLPMGLSGWVAFAMLIWIYATRFTAAGAEPMQAALARAPASMDYAAQSLGANRLRRTLEVDLPIAMSGAAAGGLILFVEALKELPATMMLRPSDWDTLAIKAHFYATDDRLAAAALPSLMITAAGLIPVILLSNRLSKSRPGGAS